MPGIIQLRAFPENNVIIGADSMFSKYELSISLALTIFLYEFNACVFALMIHVLYL